MQIRRITVADAPQYRALRVRALAEHPEAFTSSAEEEDRQPLAASEKRLASPHHMFWGTFDGPLLHGMVGIERETKLKARHKAKVIGMYVARELGGAGAGRALLHALVSQARDAGIELLVLTVTDGNGAATALYESLGFRSFGIEPRAIKVGERYFGKNHMYLELT